MGTVVAITTWSDNNVSHGEAMPEVQTLPLNIPILEPLLYTQQFSKSYFNSKSGVKILG